MNYSRWKLFPFWENHLPFLTFLGVQGCLPVAYYHCGWGSLGRSRPQKPEGCRCSVMNSQPYLSPKWIISDENSSCFEKTVYTFYLFMVCRAIGAGGLGAAQGPRKPEGSRCSEMHSQPYLGRFFWCARLSGRSPIFFSWSQSTIIFFKEFQGTIIFFNSIHAPPPPPPPPPGYLMVNA